MPYPFRKKTDAVEIFAVIAAVTTIVMVIWLNDLDRRDAALSSESGQHSQETESGSLENNSDPLSTGLITQPLLSGPGSQSPLYITGHAGSIPAKDRVKFKIDRFKKLALQPLEFEIFDEQKKPYTPENLQTIEGQKVHFIVVSANFKEFLHLNPTFEKGKWKTLANLPNPGTYYAYSQIVPENGKSVVLRSELIVREPSAIPADVPGVTENLTATSDRGNLQAQLILSRPSVLQQTVLEFYLSFLPSSSPLLSSQSSSQISTASSEVSTLSAPSPDLPQLQPFYGSLGSVTVLRHHDPDSFMRILPLVSSDPSPNFSKFLTTFLKSGRYTAFAEFRVAQRTRRFIHTFEIR